MSPRDLAPTDPFIATNPARPFSIRHRNMRDDVSTSASVARFLRANMVGWSHALCDEIDGLAGGESVDLRTLYGPCRVTRNY